MNIYESDYWKLTRFFEKHIGMSPFQTNSRKNYIAWIYVYSFTISFMVSMGIRWYNEFGVDIGIVIENGVGELYLLFIIYKLSYSILCRKKLRSLYEEVANDWRIMEDAEDLKIMHKYTAMGAKIVSLYTGYLIGAVVLFLLLPVFTPLLDYIVPLENATRPKALPFYAEYGVDIEEYYYPLIAQAIFGGIGTIIVLATFDIGFMMIVQHVVAMFELVKHRLSKAAEVAATIELGKKDVAEKNNIVRRYIVEAITFHQKSINYVHLVENCYSLAWLSILFANVGFMGGGMTIVVMKISHLGECFRYAVVLGAGFMHFYYIFLPGQKIIDCSEDVFNHCYACDWYNLSEESKGLIKVMMLRSVVRCELTGGKMFVLCMETYCKMMKAGYTIFTVLTS